MFWRYMGSSSSFFIVLTIFTFCLPALDAQDGAVNDLLDQGLTSYKEGNMGQAIQSFEKALQLDPSRDAVLEFLDRATTVEIMRMVRSEDRRISGIGQTLLKLRRKKSQARSTDPDELQQAIKETFDASGQKLLELKIRNANIYGRNLVPDLVSKLGNAEVKQRAIAQTWITQIGRDSIPVLIAAADHSNPLVRMAVAKLLGARTLRHQFSVATLASIFQTDEDPGAREAAKKSLLAIFDARLRHDLSDRSSGSAKIGEAKYYHFNNARFLYLNPHKNEFNLPSYVPMIYYLKNDEVVSERVLDFQVNERMAEQALYQALKLDANFEKANQLMLCNDALQAVEYQEALKIYETDGEAMSLLESQEPAINYVVRPRLLAAPKEILFGALGMALDDRYTEVSEEILRIVQQTQRRGPTPRSMLAALLETSARTVRVRSAVALAEWNPTDLTPSLREMIVSILSEAILNSGIRVAHKVMGNPDNINRFGRLLADLNVESYSNSKDTESGLTRASQLPPDLILIDEMVRSSVASSNVTPINFFINRIRKDFRTAETPIVVVLESGSFNEQKKIYQNEENRVYVVSHDVDKSRLKESVLLPLFEGVEDAKGLALELGTLAARVLEELSSTNSEFPVGGSIEILERVIVNRPDPIKIHCLGVLGNLRDQAHNS